MSLQNNAKLQGFPKKKHPNKTSPCAPYMDGPVCFKGWPGPGAPPLLAKKLDNLLREYALWFRMRPQDEEHMVQELNFARQEAMSADNCFPLELTLPQIKAKIKRVRHMFGVTVRSPGAKFGAWVRDENSPQQTAPPTVEDFGGSCSEASPLPDDATDTHTYADEPSSSSEETADEDPETDDEDEESQGGVGQTGTKPKRVYGLRDVNKLRNAWLRGGDYMTDVLLARRSMPVHQTCTLVHHAGKSCEQKALYRYARAQQV